MFASTREKWRRREGGRVTIDGATGFAPCLPRGKSTRTSRLSLAPPRLLSMYDIYMRVISPFFSTIVIISLLSYFSVVYCYLRRGKPGGIWSAAFASCSWRSIDGAGVAPRLSEFPGFCFVLLWRLMSISSRFSWIVAFGFVLVVWLRRRSLDGSRNTLASLLASIWIGLAVGWLNGLKRISEMEKKKKKKKKKPAIQRCQIAVIHRFCSRMN